MRRIEQRIGLMGLIFWSVVGCVPDDSLNNEDFDLWCDEGLCSWDIIDGKVEKAATWHRKEIGAKLVGNPAAIGQRITDEASKCFQFTVVADVPDNAELLFQVDFMDDDATNPEFSTPVKAASWERFFVEVPKPEWANVMRIILRKSGKGEVVLARVADERLDVCGKQASTVKKPEGISCEDDDECQSDLCGSVTIGEISGHTCAGCASHEACAGDEVCGLEFQFARDAYLDCGEAGRKSLGERCAFDEECDTSICCDNRCATCCDGGGCEGDAACKQRDEAFPYQCAPKGGAAEKGDPCLVDEDCASEQCENDDDEILSVCLSDGRPCSNDEDCPAYLGGGVIADLLDEHLDTDACVALGLRFGTCR